MTNQYKLPKPTVREDGIKHSLGPTAFTAADVQAAYRAGLADAVPMTSEEMAALMRFDETCEDDQGYDVPIGMMQRLGEIGVVQHLGRRVYYITEIGRAILDSAAPKPSAGGQA
jgi:hypothetical protein